MVARHRLDPLLRPRSLALVGASPRAGSVGWNLIENVQRSGFSGPVYAVNPNYGSISGVACYPSLDALPGPAEHVALGVSMQRVEEQFDRAIAHGARAVTIIASLLGKEEAVAKIHERLIDNARRHDVLMAGPMSMGFHNFADGVRVFGFQTRCDHRAGGVALVTQSGSVINALVDCESRIDYNLVVSTGVDAGVTVADYVDFAVNMPSTRVLGVFIEAIRDVQTFRGALKTANHRGLPVVALKVGRSQQAARFVTSHSGAMVGQDGAYQALFDRFGVTRVRSLDEMAVTLMMFAQPYGLVDGDLALVHESGGERALMADLLADANVQFAPISDATRQRLEVSLDPGMPATNPVDVWGTGKDHDKVVADCLHALMSDDSTAIGAIVSDRGIGGRVYEGYIDQALAVSERTAKPIFIVSSNQGSGFSDAAIVATRRGVPVLDGMPNFIAGTKHLMNYNAFRARNTMHTPVFPKQVLQRWQRMLEQHTAMTTHAMELLSASGLAAVPAITVRNGMQAARATQSFGFPVVLKTASAELSHKSDSGGVSGPLHEMREVQQAYTRMAQQHGDSIAVSPWRTDVVAELLLGMVDDEQLGATVVIGAGGIDAELLDDKVFAVPPFDRDEALRLLDRLRCRPLLNPRRGRAGGDINAVCRYMARFSQLVAGLGDAIKEVDINPLAVTPHGCEALDALVVRASIPGRRALADTPSLRQGAAQS